MIIRSLLYGYLGAVVAGLVVAIVGMTLGFDQGAIATAASPAGVFAGVLALSLPWARPALARIRSRR